MYLDFAHGDGHTASAADIHVTTSDYFELEMPDIFHELRPTDHWDGIKPTHLGRKVMLTMPDPIYFESGAPYRFSLRLKKYQARVPNHALIRIVAASNHGESTSHNIFTR